MHIGIAVAAGIAVGAALVLLAVQVFGATSVGKARRIHRQLVDDAEREAEALRREAQIESREQAIKLRADIDAEHADRRAQMLKIEERVLAKEEEIERKLVELDAQDQGLADRETHLRQLQDELKQAKATQQSRDRARRRHDAPGGARHICSSAARSSCGTTSRAASACSRRRHAPSRSAARATSSPMRCSASPRATPPRRPSRVIELPSDDMKGRIIGREGRNIRALEHLTGVDFIIDDTPHAVVLSSFDGLRREIARLTLTKLIEDGRIHPARIEEMYYQSKAELEDIVRQAGEQAVFEANCGPFHEELVNILGRLRFRTSYGQNVLKHTLEVVHLAGIMATELGASVQTAKRAAMLHDLGKAMTHEIEGSHALISAQFARRYGESQGVVHADRGAPLRGAAADRRGRAPHLRRRDLRVTPGRARREPRALHQAARVARGARRVEAGRRQGLRAPGRTRDPRHRPADRGRRRRSRRCSRTRSRARSRTSSSIPAR